MRPLLTCALCLALLLPAAPAAAAHHPINLAFLYPISTNQDPDISTNLRLSLFYGRVGSVRGLDLNGVVAVTGGDMRGFQMTGVYSQVGGDMKGIQWTGAVNYVRGQVYGLQVAYLGDVVHGSVSGVQFGGLFNLVGTDVYGLQISGLVNIVDGNASFVQWTGVANSVGGAFEGLQVSGGYNYVGERLSGVQFSLVNFAMDMHGAQAGLANFARDAHGLQLGAINWTRNQHGVPVGVVNLADDGLVGWVAYASNLSPINIGVRTEVRGWYSTLTLGGGDSKGDVQKTLILTWNYGRAFPLAQKTRLGLDFGFAHYVPEIADDPTENDRLHFAVQARGHLEQRLSPKLVAFAGGGIARIFSEYSDDATGETEPLIFGGVSLF